jgi:hypothetical protein
MSIPNLVDAVERQGRHIQDRNLPIYIKNYVAYLAPHHTTHATIQWSSVSFMPSLEDRRRILRIQLASTIDVPFADVRNELSELTFCFDFTTVAELVKNDFQITLEGPLEGYITVGDSTSTLNAYKHVKYNFSLGRSLLLLHLADIPSSISWTLPVPLFMDIAIKDDVTDDYPPIYPIVAASKIARIPLTTGYRGQGIRIVLPLFICCPDELKTMQITEQNINNLEAFDCRSEVNWLLDSQGIPMPRSYSIRASAAEDYPVDMDQEPLDWKFSSAMLHMCYEIESLVPVIPDCEIILLYTYSQIYNGLNPAYLGWLVDHLEEYDMVVMSQYFTRGENWDPNDFQVRLNNSSNVHRYLYENGKHFIASQSNDGEDLHITGYNNKFLFDLVDPHVIAMGGFILSQLDSFNLNGPYKASQYSGGGYCNMVAAIFDQFGVNYSPQNGSPDIAGYFGRTYFSQDVQHVESASGCSFTVQPFAALLALIMNNTRKKDWPFKFILYRKASSMVMLTNMGSNLGAPPKRYNCSAFSFWNPVCGLGGVNGGYFYKMCNNIRNNTVVQISSFAMGHNVSFMNFMPRNTFADPLSRQPVFGYSSIFSLFRIYRAIGSGIPGTENVDLLTNSPMYLVDITGRYALAYGVDDTDKLYVFIQPVNYGSIYQKWIFRNVASPDSPVVITAFDKLTLSPFDYDITYMTSVFNANQSARPNAPSISMSSAPSEDTIFMLNTDPASDDMLDEITRRLTNDATEYSYYVNFTATLLDNSLVFLNNPTYRSVTSDPATIYDARRTVLTGQVVPRWGPFMEHPQWVLVPILESEFETAYEPYQSKLIIGSTFMIYNSVLQSYLCLNDVQDRITFESVHSVTGKTIPFHQFLFTLSKFGLIFQDLFSPKDQVRNGVVRVSAEFNIFRESVSIFTQQMKPPDDNGIKDYYPWKMPTELGEDLAITVDLVFPGPDREFIEVYWVFKKYILTLGRYSEFVAYNDLSTPQENNGKLLSALNGDDNLFRNSPSMQAPTFRPLANGTWRIDSTTHVQDTYTTSSKASSYIVLDENLAEVSRTTLTIISGERTQTDPPLEQAMTVYGPGPQPFIVALPFDASPESVEWSASTINRFVQDPASVSRYNYMYLNTTYSFYSSTGYLDKGFLSTGRKYSPNDTVGWAPSLYNPREGTSILNGTKNTIWTVV